MIDVAEYLDRKGIEYRVSGDELQANCPFCGDIERKFFIHASTGAWICHHANRCGRHGSFWQLQQELGDEPERSWQKSIRVQPRPRVVPKGGFADPDAATIAWFARRGLTLPVVQRFGIRQSVTDHPGWIAFPYVRDGQVVNYKFRGPAKEFAMVKDARLTLFGRDLVGKDATDLVIVEGEPDAMAMSEYGISVVSAPNGAKGQTWVEEEWDYLARFKRLFVCFDGDEAGRNGTDDLIRRLGWRWPVYRVALPFKDANECLQAGVPAEEIRRAVAEAEEVKPGEVKTLAEIPLEGSDEPEPGDPCEIPGLTQILGGWRRGELTIHGGHSYSGKSTATSFEAAGILRRFKRVCVCNLEMKARSVIYTMRNQLGMTQEEFWQAFGGELVFVDVRQGVKIETLVELMQYVAARYAPVAYLVDSLGCIALGGGKDDYYFCQKDAAATFARFAKDNDTHVHLVHHFNKAGGKNAGDGLDLEGSGWIRNLADNVVLYKRVEERDPASPLAGVDAIVRVDKNRAFGRNGEVCLRFDQDTKRYALCGGGEF